MDANAVNAFDQTALYLSLCNGHVEFALVLLCFGTKMRDEDFKKNEVEEFLLPIHELFKLRSEGKHITRNLLSNEEKTYMWNLAFVLALKHRGTAYRVFQIIRSFITLHGIFMAHGYEIGEGSLWNKQCDYERNRFYKF